MTDYEQGERETDQRYADWLIAEAKRQRRQHVETIATVLIVLTIALLIALVVGTLR